jgi:hypothetical protein
MESKYSNEVKSSKWPICPCPIVPEDFTKILDKFNFLASGPTNTTHLRKNKNSDRSATVHVLFSYPCPSSVPSILSAPPHRVGKIGAAGAPIVAQQV